MNGVRPKEEMLNPSYIRDGYCSNVIVDPEYSSMKNDVASIEFLKNSVFSDMRAVSYKRYVGDAKRKREEVSDGHSVVKKRRIEKSVLSFIEALSQLDKGVDDMNNFPQITPNVSVVKAFVKNGIPFCRAAWFIRSYHKEYKEKIDVYTEAVTMLDYYLNRSTSDESNSKALYIIRLMHWFEQENIISDSDYIKFLQESIESKNMNILPIALSLVDQSLPSVNYKTSEIKRLLYACGEIKKLTNNLQDKKQKKLLSPIIYSILRKIINLCPDTICLEFGKVHHLFAETLTSGDDFYNSLSSIKFHYLQLNSSKPKSFSPYEIIIQLDKNFNENCGDELSLGSIEVDNFICLCCDWCIERKDTKCIEIVNKIFNNIETYFPKIQIDFQNTLYNYMENSRCHGDYFLYIMIYFFIESGLFSYISYTRRLIASGLLERDDKLALIHSQYIKNIPTKDIFRRNSLLKNNKHVEKDIVSLDKRIMHYINTGELNEPLQKSEISAYELFLVSSSFMSFVEDALKQKTIFEMNGILYRLFCYLEWIEDVFTLGNLVKYLIKEKYNLPILNPLKKIYQIDSMDTDYQMDIPVVSEILKFDDSIVLYERHAISNSQLSKAINTICKDTNFKSSEISSVLVSLYYNCPMWNDDIESIFNLIIKKRKDNTSIIRIAILSIINGLIELPVVIEIFQSQSESKHENLELYFEFLQVVLCGSNINVVSPQEHSVLIKQTQLLSYEECMQIFNFLLMSDMEHSFGSVEDLLKNHLFQNRFLNNQHFRKYYMESEPEKKRKILEIFGYHDIIDNNNIPIEEYGIWDIHVLCFFDLGDNFDKSIMSQKILDNILESTDIDTTVLISYFSIEDTLINLLETLISSISSYDMLESYFGNRNMRTEQMKDVTTKLIDTMVICLQKLNSIDKNNSIIDTLTGYLKNIISLVHTEEFLNEITKQTFVMYIWKRLLFGIGVNSCSSSHVETLLFAILEFLSCSTIWVNFDTVWTQWLYLCSFLSEKVPINQERLLSEIERLSFPEQLQHRLSHSLDIELHGKIGSDIMNDRLIERKPITYTTSMFSSYRNFRKNIDLEKAILKPNKQKSDIEKKKTKKLDHTKRYKDRSHKERSGPPPKPESHTKTLPPKRPPPRKKR
eukprot:TRINITY_DN5251_c0_g1_i1.p1 TRINITY_DN5251_c0_g1~~TRINITY_DN5251_c0_g1_i1.p1  ORF type:complete len:1135 (+),score=222.30 TRINITY_DN5251_c0_g1_i1:456-3860(+)